LQMRTLGVVGFEEDWLSHCIDKFYKSTIIKKFLNLKDKHLYENQNGEIVE
jgi:hypothetical protein